MRTVWSKKRGAVQHIDNAMVEAGDVDIGMFQNGFELDRSLDHVNYTRSGREVSYGLV